MVQAPFELVATMSFVLKDGTEALGAANADLRRLLGIKEMCFDYYLDSAGI